MLDTDTWFWGHQLSIYSGAVVYLLLGTDKIFGQGAAISTQILILIWLY